MRTRLDELKREELERLRHLAIKQFELANEIDRDHLKINEHLDHENPHTFEQEDLRKLILKTSNELAETDRLRREEFKRYEMQKEFEQHQKLEGMDDVHKKEYEAKLEEEKKKHNQHAPVHAPGHKAQLEEVWEKQDHMEGQDFDPQTFFMMHDLDGNGVWDELEVKALFARELDKVYQSGVPEDDMRERAEEMERMREHVFKEADTNQDHLISYEEFIEQTKRAEFQQDQKWDTVDNVPQYTHEEYLDYERKRQEEIQRLIAEGLLPPHPNMPGGYHPGPGQPMYQQQQHPNEIPHYQQQQQQQHMGQMGHHEAAAARMADDHHQAQQMHYQQQQQPAQGHHPNQGVPQTMQQQQQQHHQQQQPQGVPQQQQQPIHHQQQGVPQQQQVHHQQQQKQQPQGHVVAQPQGVPQVHKQAAPAAAGVVAGQGQVNNNQQHGQQPGANVNSQQQQQQPGGHQ